MLFPEVVLEEIPKISLQKQKDFNPSKLREQFS